MVVYIAGQMTQRDPNPPATPTTPTIGRMLYALTNGSVFWVGNLGNPLNPPLDDVEGVASSPAVGPDGTVYIGSADGFFYSFASNGALRWRYPLPGAQNGPFRTAPVITADGRIFLFREKHIVGQPRRALVSAIQDTATGPVPLWDWPASVDFHYDGAAISSAALAPDGGTLYVGLLKKANNASVGTLFAINVSQSAPSHLWSWPATNSGHMMGPIASSPVIGVDGTVYVGTQSGFTNASTAVINVDPGLYAFNPLATGTSQLKWILNTPFPGVFTNSLGQPLPGGAVDSSPCIGPDGTLYVGVDEPTPYVMAVHPDTGLPIWKCFDKTAPVPGSFETSPVLGADNIIHIRSVGNGVPALLYAINATTGTILSKTPAGFETDGAHAPNDTPYSSPALDREGRIYFGTTGSVNLGEPGQVFCFQTTSTGHSFWPKFRGDEFNTGSVSHNKWTTNFSPQITITDLPALTDNLNHYTISSVVQNADEVVGYSQTPVGSALGVHAVRWKTNFSGYQAIGLGASPSGNSVARSINNHSYVVGYNTDFFQSTRAAYWPSNGTLAMLPHAAGWGRSEALDINTSSYSVAGTAVNSAGTYRAVRWNTLFGAFEDLWSLAGSLATYRSYAFAINDKGHIVGKSITTLQKEHGFLCSPNLKLVAANDIGTIYTDALNDYSEARGLNERGQVVGASTVSPGQTNAFLKAHNSGTGLGFSNLGSLGGNYGVAISVNNRGQAVGWARKANGTSTAFIKLPGQPIKALNTLHSDPAWDLVSAESINDQGRVAGWGYRNGVVRGFVVQPK